MSEPDTRDETIRLLRKALENTEKIARLHARRAAIAETAVFRPSDLLSMEEGAELPPGWEWNGLGVRAIDPDEPGSHVLKELPDDRPLTKIEQMVADS